MKFVAIFTSNLDEFFMIRVGSLYDMVHTDAKAKDSRSGMTAQEQIHAILTEVAPLYKERGKTYAEIKKRITPYGVCGLDYKRVGASGKEICKCIILKLRYYQFFHLRSWMRIIHFRIF